MKILVVGAGFSGAVIGRELAEAGHYVHIIDKRNHIAGNAYDYTNEHGIRVHKYGPHLFHTNNKDVVYWLSRFTEWAQYQHRVKALLGDGRYVTLPVNRATKQIVGKDNILDTFFRPYTKKMWGIELDELDPKIIDRVPSRNDMNDLYFPDDEFQLMPKHGYTRLFENIFQHENITVSLSTEFSKSYEKDYNFIFNSMPIDEYHDYIYGDLPYRSIKFHNVHIPAPRLLPVTCVNFTHDGPYTRMTEWKNIPEHGDNKCFTTITYEEPCDYRDNDNERYYPVKDLAGKNRELYKRYRELTPKNVEFIGRCGMYVYLDMHQVVSSSLATVKRFLCKK